MSSLATESPRWLLQRGRTEEATKVLEKAVSWNGAHMGKSVHAIVDELVRNQENISVSSLSNNVFLCVIVLDLESCTATPDATREEVAWSNEQRGHHHCYACTNRKR
ncbi:hypothetical protein SK128_003379 [Halocaridina rubra]|uniref:Uncharacterized protein n=1 Tax=Halocaridina rubra TaxID=373956 RepID=A0AAN9ABG9_HALRR